MVWVQHSSRIPACSNTLNRSREAVLVCVQCADLAATGSVHDLACNGSAHPAPRAQQQEESYSSVVVSRHQPFAAQSLPAPGSCNTIERLRTDEGVTACGCTGSISGGRRPAAHPDMSPGPTAAAATNPSTSTRIPTNTIRPPDSHGLLLVNATQLLVLHLLLHT